MADWELGGLAEQTPYSPLTNALGISQTQNTLVSGQTPMGHDKTQNSLALEQTS